MAYSFTQKVYLNIHLSQLKQYAYPLTKGGLSQTEW
jgi:hypothetical protein